MPTKLFFASVVSWVGFVRWSIMYSGLTQSVPSADTTKMPFQQAMSRDLMLQPADVNAKWHTSNENLGGQEQEYHQGTLREHCAR